MSGGAAALSAFPVFILWTRNKNNTQSRLTCVCVDVLRASSAELTSRL